LESDILFPILEYDPDPHAVLEPAQNIHHLDAMPRRAVLCFFQEVITALIQQGKLMALHSLKSEMGHHPIFELSYRGSRLAVFHPGVGAPLAAGFLEELIALGCEKFIACGGAGVLDSSLAVGHILVPTAAIRDEGTSYHYLPPGREVQANPAAIEAIEATLTEHKVPYLKTKTWTTDAFYRETAGRIQQRKADGCLTVEMEAAAFFAVARFRSVSLGQILYGGDDVGSEQWDSRDWETHTPLREKLFWLAVEACLRL
jgi:uridine phosphorylase